MFQWSAIWQYLFSGLFIHAAWTTLWISVVAQFIGVVLGLFLALMRISRLPILSWPARAYIWLFRGSPLLVQILILFVGIPELFPPGTATKVLTPVVCVLIAFSLNEGAYMAEIVRAGISSVDPGQMEAAKALGMQHTLGMRRVVIPQAIRIIIPPLGNEFNNMLKSASLAAVIGLLELTGTAQVYGAQAFNEFELLIVATFWYLVLTTLWGYVQRWIEIRLDPDRTPSNAAEKKSWGQRLTGIGSPQGEVLASRSH
ncbi:MAG TPA: amino acid ABC transporter permease [Ktedonobacteraceae bacterium]|jgi:polar amino acid transport system permease protein|nr:amino acid ABC transporter permease [Ktedonobacteraceae bacterium]